MYFLVSKCSKDLIQKKKKHFKTWTSQEMKLKKKWVKGKRICRNSKNRTKHSSWKFCMELCDYIIYYVWCCCGWCFVKKCNSNKCKKMQKWKYINYTKMYTHMTWHGDQFLFKWLWCILQFNSIHATPTSPPPPPQYHLNFIHFYPKKKN